MDDTEDALLVRLGVEPVPLPAELVRRERAASPERVVEEGLLGHLVVELCRVPALAQEALVHARVGLQHQHPDVDAVGEPVAREDVVADPGLVGFILGREQLGAAPLPRGDGLVEDAVEGPHGERVQVQEGDAREVQLRPDVELGEEVAPPREGEHLRLAVGVLGRVPGDELQLADDGARGEEEVALLLRDEGRHEDDDRVRLGAGLGVPQEAVHELHRRQEVGVRHAVVARRQVRREGELARPAVVVRAVLLELRDVEDWLDEAGQVLLELELDLVEAGGRGGGPWGDLW